MQKSIAGTLLALILCLGHARAQTASGRVFDSTENKDVAHAVIALLQPGDSILLQFTRSGKDGRFSLPKVAPGRYVLMLTHPYYADFLDEITVPVQGMQLGTLRLIPKSRLLDEVLVKTRGAIRIKGDTVSYTADSFKTGPNANVEDLLKKLPGIQVGRNGEIKAMGEKVEKVLVDGEEFFGDDPGMAVKNLRADAVKEVQVYDKKSEQAEFTGIDDGQKQKTINLKLKEDRKKGYFGKVDLSGGLLKHPGNRHNTNIMFNAFKGKRKIAGYLLNGNTGQNGLNWQDQQKFGGEDENTSFSMDEDGGFMVTRTGGSEDEPWIDTRNGYFDNLNTGVQYTNKWLDKHSLNFSPKYNYQQYTNLKTTYSQVQLSDTSLYNEQLSEQTDSRKRNIKNNLIYDFKIDSMNSLKLTARLNIYHSESLVALRSENRDQNGLLNNSRESRTSNETDRTSFSSSLVYKHKFRKDRRTFSLNADYSSRDVEGNTFLYSKNDFTKVSRTDLIDQQKRSDNSNRKLLARAVYTEPLSKKYSLELNYELSWLNGDNNLNTYDKSAGGRYEVFVDSLSNRFRQDITTNKAGVRISYKNKKFKFNLGSAAGFTSFNFRDITNDTVYKRNFTNLFPSAGLNYTYKPNHNLGINYNGNTIQPTINQLQRLRNNNNTLYQTLGNPDLKQSFRHDFSINHNMYNFVKELWTYQGINFNFTQNAITNNVMINPLTGETLSQPVNTNGNFSANVWSGMGTKIKKPGIYVNLNYQLNMSKFIDFVNGIRNQNTNTGHSIGINLSKFSEKKYEISVGNDFGFNSNRNTVYNRRIRYNTYSVNADVSVYIKKNWKLGTDFQYNYRQKTSEFDRTVNNSLWNAILERNFHQDEYTVFFTVRDILNQNVGIDRSFYGNTLKEERNERLQRFWLLGFRWNFKNKGDAPAK